MNKKLIRLTESDLHRIVKESVNKVLNEIGDTTSGQDLLGRLATRKYLQGDREGESNVNDYAMQSAINTHKPVVGGKHNPAHNDLRQAYWKGEKDEYDDMSTKYAKKRFGNEVKKGYGVWPGSLTNSELKHR